MITDRERAVFEAGIKLGALYHQWVGTPVSRETAEMIEHAIEESVSLQPFVTGITVHLDRSMMDPNPFGYSEVKGAMFSVGIETRVGDVRCRAALEFDGRYPLMKVMECD
jgi:hypothetical protein